MALGEVLHGLELAFRNSERGFEAGDLRFSDDDECVSELLQRALRESVAF
ncbi:hypothetical protein I6J42_33845 (plasmid) [Streptomyces californicus]|uniref:Uncharacterized protein n=1 Tax=Streptomyces californicus TaxID=67351 RepID=A0ABD7D9H8_9ACTN|nr:hypothetical protein [Streptomyces californicus]QRV39078.1 hypothetical protein I6J42_33845 [Streptomyces californicus]QRV52531.1 hypothetical protein I6J43_33865 [Streptomyces californicus]